MAKRKESGIAPKEVKESPKEVLSEAVKGSKQSKRSSKESPQKSKDPHKTTDRKDDSLSTEVIGEKEESRKVEDDFMDDGR